MDKIVIFDWGGVVVNLENDGLEHHNVIIRTMRRLGCNLSDEKILDLYFDHVRHGADIHVDTIANPADVIKWWDLGKNKFQISADYDDFSRIYTEEFLKAKYYPDVADYSRSLKSRCKIGILSNLALFDKKVIDAHYHLADFNKVYLSYELGMRKPDHEIYHYIQDDLKIAPENILFLDDLEPNVLAAKSCGWRVCHATGRELDKIKLAVEAFLES